MNQQSFAAFIGVSPATLSSIFNGRTQPTLNIANRICARLNNVSLSWLLYGTGEMNTSPLSPAEPQMQTPAMTATGEGASSQQLPTASQGASSAPGSTLAFQFDETQQPPKTYRHNAPTTGQLLNHLPLTPQQQPTIAVKKADKPQRRISEIRVFYDDQTWETFVPKR